jgi:AhpD family alkylhydroperoxidase
MEPRMKNPAAVIPGAWQAVSALAEITKTGGLPASTLGLVHLRASQINGCSACVDGGVKSALKSGETAERLGTVAAWREAPYFSDAERAALALTEAATRLADSPDPVPDEIWDEAARHYDEQGLASLVLAITVANVFNRLNRVTRQPAGQWG